MDQVEEATELEKAANAEIFGGWREGPIMRRSEYLAYLDAKFEREFGPKLRQLREINRLALHGEISEEERLLLHEGLFPGFREFGQPSQPDSSHEWDARSAFSG